MLVIRSGRHPHEALLMAVFAVAGTAGLLATDQVTRPGSLLSELPRISVLTFYAVLLVGSVVTIAGTFTRGLSGPIIERFGLGILAIELIGYGVALFGLYLLQALFFALITVGIGAANVWRMVQVTKEIHQAKSGAAATHTQRHLGD